MSEKSEPNLNEMANVAGSGEGLALPPAFVMVNPRQHRKYKKGNDKVMVALKVPVLSLIVSNAEK